ncbi:MAG: hypothetical protein Q9190_004254 [Brigantiaea leucoxantha]
MASEEELANMQKLSNDYVPDVQGPLVGQRQSSQALIAEYAQADPVYVHKTTALPRTYSHYRTVKGDGNCGWRALAFGYFEALLRLGDSSKIAREVVRLKSLNNLLNTTGLDPDLYIDFVEVTLELLEQTATSFPCQDDGAALLNSFNDEGLTGAIITHFRLVTSAWMKTHADLYKDFLLGQTVEQYCMSHIQPFSVEIENHGLNALIDAIIKPAGMAVDVLYLDRSPGEEVNAISWQPDTPTHNPGYPHPTIRLLYRPGHYDILYKPEDLPSLPTPTFTAPQVHMMSEPVIPSAAHGSYFEQGLDLNQYFIPGLSTMGVSNMPFSTSYYPHTSAYSPMNMPTSPPVSEAYSKPVAPSGPSPTMEPSRYDAFRFSKFNLQSEYNHWPPPLEMEPCQTDAMKQ